jgi:hypothetical protein
MGALDAAFRSLASTLIGAFSSTPATYARAAAPRYDPREGQELVFAPVTYSIKITPPLPYRKSEVNGTTVQATDLRCYISAKDLPIEPDPRTDSLTWKGFAFQVISASPVGTADANVLIELQLRR